MLLISLAFAGVVIVLLAIDEIRIRKHTARIEKLEKHLDMWKLAARHITRDNERMSRDLMS